MAADAGRRMSLICESSLKWPAPSRREREEDAALLKARCTGVAADAGRRMVLRRFERPKVAVSWRREQEEWLTRADACC